MKAKKVADSKTVMTEMIMPNDTNPIHNLMGGNLMRWMDVAAGICAGRHCESYVVTVSVDHVSFQKPIPLGDVITLQCSVTRAFSTSVEVYVEVFSADIKGGNTRRCNDAYFTFVAVDDESKRPREVPQVLPLTAEQEKRYEEALHRRQMRLLLAGRIKADEANELRQFLFEE
ncbi:acyl-CoA thioesterase [Saprospira sp. CCB-QB6]|uniref:acyl-CoA thioesterase n=1 Tax=Saprospira sp. CCB-QB6 TaxID=3023936 RepID=UPI0023492069|nr:acyl-CoA thioesterase [Saprospira sp. CCB-QB6]WCL81982.1 acyl-CoA thioesterase [Saprospira sp. CCB-QB6]